MIIPYEDLDQETLENIIRENIVRSTSDFEGDFDIEISKVLEKIKNNEIYLVFLNVNNDVTLVSAENVEKSQLIV
jgi:uncharacterized protein YheU (UPF0270 family)